jgi:hypothetical protein
MSRPNPPPHGIAISLQYSHSSQWPPVWINPLEVKTQVLAIQDVMDQVPFGSHCKYPADSNANPYVVSCEMDYTGIDHNLTAVCDSQSGVYAEEMATVLFVKVVVVRRLLRKPILLSTTIAPIVSKRLSNTAAMRAVARIAVR